MKSTSNFTHPTIDAMEFDTHYEREIIQAKKDIATRLKRKTRQINNPNPNLNRKEEQKRDEHGFKVKTVELDQISNPIEYEVVIDGPLRKIRPYYFNYKTFCKERWRDKKLVDIFTKEFRDRSSDYYKKMISHGGVLVNGIPSNIDTIVRNGDMIIHRVHRHEPPVTSTPIKIIFEDEHLLVIDKPSGIPVHPSGRSRFNTVTKILENDMGLVVHPCNRLDKPTSGLMFLAKTSKGADDIADKLKARDVTKEYIARVKGEFPPGEVIVDKPIKSIDRKVSLNAVALIKPGDDGDNKTAKHAKTIFERISYDGVTSIIKCKPLTGRTHQIRVHLQYIGYPIANDPLYSNESVWGPNLGKGGMSDFTSVISKLDSIGKTAVAGSWMFPNEDGKLLLDSECEECGIKIDSEPSTGDINLWLHAFRYELKNYEKDGASDLKESTGDHKCWSYKTDFPDWALEPHHKYMELALKEAQKCDDTTTAFSVGAVLVNGDNILETGYSRELLGNTHAEQCAMEKYFTKKGKRELPMGTVLYTTMEPCSFRLSGNKPCSDRIVDAGGAISTVFVGVLEPDTFVKHNTGKILLESHNISYIHIPGYEEESIRIAKKGHPDEE